MADSIQMRVTRYTPARPVPTVAEYEVPLRKDWGSSTG